MSYLSEAHSEWHYVNGRYAVCPLDCGVGEAMMLMEDAMTDESLALLSDEVVAFHGWQNDNVPDEDEYIDLDLFYGF